jgi:hypothetical protein
VGESPAGCSVVKTASNYSAQSYFGFDSFRCRWRLLRRRAATFHLLPYGLPTTSESTRAPASSWHRARYLHGLLIDNISSTKTHLQLALVQVDPEARDTLGELVEGQAAVRVAVQMLQHVHQVLDTG